MNRSITIAALAVVAVVALAGCNSGSVSQSSLDQSGSGSASSLTAALEKATAELQFYRLYRTHNTILSSRVHHDYDPDGVSALCDSRDCISASSKLPRLAMGVNAGDLAGDMTENGLERATEAGELQVFKWSVDKTYGRRPTHVSATHYGAWLEHSAFVVSALRFTWPDNSRQGSYGGAWGSQSEIQPFPLQGEAHWNGAMLAIDPTTEEVFAGKAGASVSFFPAGPTMHIGFTEIAGIESGARRGDIEFPAVNVTTERFFHWEGDDFHTSRHYVDGKFFGPDRAEIAGVFGSDGLTGSFGARKAK